MDTELPTINRFLDHERVSELLGVLPGLCLRLDCSAAPGCNRNVSPLSKLLGMDLVAQELQRLGIWSKEHDTQPLAKVREPGFFSDETPANPGCIGLGNYEGLLNMFRIQVAALVPSVSPVDDRCQHHNSRTMLVVVEDGKMRVLLYLIGTFRFLPKRGWCL